MTPSRALLPIAIVGGGSIGVAFAIVFAKAGLDVRLYEPDPTRRADTPALVAARLAALHRHGLLGETPDAVAARIATPATLEAAVDGVIHVQECAPERLDLKQQLFAALDGLVPDTVTLASSSSAIPASRFADGLAGKARILVAHPGNPPFLIPIIEIVPAPFTATETCERAAALFRQVGLEPILLHREVEGFVFNRLQGAMLREAYCLVRDGVVGVAEIDRIVRDGLAPRWSVVGPFETVDLNTQGGIVSHAEKMGPAYARMGAERGQDDPWTPDLVARVAAERRAALPLTDWAERVEWRDEQLMRLVKRRSEGAA